MSLDWIDFYHFQQDAQPVLENSKVQKIFQPFSDQLVFELYIERQRIFLNIIASQMYPGIFLSSHQGPQPEEPSAFCMLLRKHLTGFSLKNTNQNVESLNGNVGLKLNF